MKELNLYPRTVYRSVNGVFTEYTYTNRELAERVGGATPQRMRDLVGRVACVWVAAPGSGRRLYRVTRVDAQGVWAVLIKDTARCS